MGRQTDVSLPADKRAEAMMRFEVLRLHCPPEPSGNVWKRNA